MAGTILANLVLTGDRAFRSAIDDAGDELTDAGADAGTFSFMLGRASAALSGVRNDAITTSGALSLLQGRADEAEDELSAAGRAGYTAASGFGAAAGSATTAGGTFTALSASTDGLSLSFGGLSTTLTGTILLIGALGTAVTGLLTTLVPLVATLTGLTAGLGALAGAFGLVMGSGMLAYGEELNKQHEERLLQVEDRIASLKDLQKERGGLSDSRRKELRELKKEKQQLNKSEGAVSALQVRFAELAETIGGILADYGAEFAPMIDSAIDYLPALVEWTLEAVGGVDAFADALRTLGRSAIEVIPNVAGSLADIAREALPILMDGLRWIGSNGGQVFDGIMETTREVAPLLADFAGDVGDALPSINRFGTAVLKDLLPALGDATKGFGNMLDEILAFAQSDDAKAIMKEIEQAAVDLGPELDELAKNAGTLFDTLVENGPELVEGFTALADTVLDLVNGLTPVMVAFIELVADASAAWNDWVDKSEQQEKNLKEQGVLGYVASGTLDTLLNAPEDSSQFTNEGRFSNTNPAAYEGAQQTPAPRAVEVTVKPSDQFEVEQREVTRDEVSEVVDRYNRGVSE